MANELYDLEIREFSGVGAPAHEDARAAIMKRRDPADPAPATKVRQPVDKDLSQVLTGETDGHQHGLSIRVYDGRLNVWVSHAKGVDDEYDHSHAIAKDDTGMFVLATVAGHTHTIDQTAMAQALIASTTKAEGPVAMSKEDLQKALDRVNKIVALPAVHKAHFDGLAEADQAPFLAKDNTEREAEVQAAVEAAADPPKDPVLYKTRDGMEIKKSHGDLALAQAKQIDQLAKANEGHEAREATRTLEKRATDELPHLPGTIQVRAAMIKAVDEIEDETTRKAAHEALKANNTAMEKAMKTAGVRGQAEPGSADDQLQKLAKTYMAKHDDATEAQAEAAVLKTDEGKRLYREDLEQD